MVGNHHDDWEQRMSGDLNKIYQMLGGLVADVQNLRQDISEVNAKIESRIDPIYPQLSEITRRTDKLEASLIDLKNDLTHEVMPVVREVKAWKQRGIGALAICGMAGGALGVTVSAHVQGLLDMFRSLFKVG